MTKKAAKRVKHVPQRTCVGCRLTLAKRSLIRVVRTPEGVRVDPTGKAAGRGAYLHDRQSCWERGLKGALAHALKTELTDQDRDSLRNFMNTLPQEPEIEETLPAGESSGPGEAASPRAEAAPDTPAATGATLTSADGEKTWNDKLGKRT